jgi:hypothetical protein
MASFKIRIDQHMKVTGKPVPTSVGVICIALAVISAAVFLPDAKQSHSPFLYICIFGGLSVGIPGALGIAIVLENRRKQH